jgi:cellulose biosynthesis protein BcsQ
VIITFYSFKGGVGRTLALANVGIILAQNGHRVLVVDFDLEAPGLTRYLENKFGGSLQYKCGLLELLEQQRDAGNSADHLQECPVEIVRSAEGGVLELLTSGRQDESYPKRVLSFDWSEFFSSDDGGNFFEHCRQMWAERYDYVLIDSRTGITDSGGICTIQLPDILVPVFTTSRQSVDGVIDVMRRAQEGRQLLAYDRAPAAIVPLPSRFDSRTEYELSQQWLDEFAIRFKEFYKSWLPKEVTIRRALERTKLPYVAFFSFGERLPVFEESGSDPESLGYALRTFARLLESKLQDASSFVASSGDGDDHGESITLTGTGGQPTKGIRDPITTTAESEREFLAASQASQRKSQPRTRRLLISLVVLLILGVAGSITLNSVLQPSTPSPSTSSVPTTAAPQTTQIPGPVAVLNNLTDVNVVTFSGDGRSLATGRSDGTVALWDVTDPAKPTQLGQPLTGHTASVTSVAFSPDGRTLASGSIDQTVRLFDVTDRSAPRLLGTPLTGHTASVTSVAFSSNGRTLASGSADKTVALWGVTDPAQPARLSVLIGHTDSITSVAFSPDGRTLASGSADQTVRLWDVTDRFRPTPVGPPLSAHTASVTSVAFSPDGLTLASGSADQTVRLWDVTHQSAPRPLDPPLTGHTEFVTSVAFSPVGRTLASGSADQTVRLWSP